MRSCFLRDAAVAALVASLIAVGSVASASAQSVTALNGTYMGSYRCTQSVTNLTLTITVSTQGELSARATIYPPTATRGQSYSYRLTGQYDARTGKFQLAPVAWETPHPADVGMIGLNGTFDSNELTGAAIGGGCSSFQVERDRAQSARTAAPPASPSAPSSPPSAAASRPAASSTARTFCYSDVKQPVVYVSGVLDTHLTHDVLALEPEEILQLGGLELDFTEFLNGKYGYPIPERERGSECIEGYDLSQSRVQQERITWIAAQRKAGKRLVDTGWTSGTSAPAAAQPSTSAGSSAGAATRSTPIVKWRADKEQPQTVLKGGPMFVNQNTEVVFMEAVCAPNGASVNFKIYDRDGQTGPQFDHHDDPSGASKTEIVDIDVSVDARAHVAKGFLPIVGDKQAVNNVGVLFYEPGIGVKLRGERQFAGRLGASVDNIIGAVAAADANAEIEEGLRTSAGPLSDLVNATSIEMRVPILGARSKAAFELSPTTPIFREFAERCYAKFGGASTSPPAASPVPPAAPSRSRPAGPTPTRRTR